MVSQCYMLFWSRRYVSCGSSMLYVVVVKGYFSRGSSIFYAVMVKAVLQLRFMNVTCCYGQGGTSFVVHQFYMLLRTPTITPD